jgi:dienelactone hydrolase
LYNISPLFHADQVTKPLMVLQGANDPRVLQVESDEIVEAVKANDVPVVYELYPDEGHGLDHMLTGLFIDGEVVGEECVDRCIVILTKHDRYHTFFVAIVVLGFELLPSALINEP